MSRVTRMRARARDNGFSRSLNRSAKFLLQKPRNSMQRPASSLPHPILGSRC